MLEQLHSLTARMSELAWGPWLLVLLLGGGGFFLIYSRFLPFRYLGHAIDLLRGKYNDELDPGQITHFQALSAALAGTIGMGNIGGVALAIHVGGPGAIFWMWVVAFFGIATKFFTCSLAIMFRGKDSNGEIQGGPMYVIREGLHRRWLFLAYVFAGAGLIGSLPAFQSNQLTQIIREAALIPAGFLALGESHVMTDAVIGLLIALPSAIIIFGGLKRIARVASAVVPFMAVLYVGTALVTLLFHSTEVPALFGAIFKDAFTGEAAAGGSLLAVILIGVKRGAYSNEAGIGTEALAHGAARTREPVREGLVAMLGPIVDTLLICTATALMILLSGVWLDGDSNGVTLTANAFQALLGTTGLIIIFVCVVCFSTTTIFTYSYYGSKCFGFLAGAQRQHWYRWVYILFIVIAAVVTLETAIGIIDTAFAIMAVPTMVSTLMLAPKVRAAALVYFRNLRAPPGERQNLRPDLNPVTGRSARD